VAAARRTASGFGQERALRLLLRQFAQPSKNRVDDYEIGVEAVDAWREDEVEAEAACDAMPPARRGVGEQPKKKFEKVRARDAGNRVPRN
jgi:hypothetical protein